MEEVEETTVTFADSGANTKRSLACAMLHRNIRGPEIDRECTRSNAAGVHNSRTAGCALRNALV
jgi:hypothetical protein